MPKEGVDVATDKLAAINSAMTAWQERIPE
jgi:hypothetical protein